MQVGSGAVAICARPNAVSLAASHFDGPGLSQCIAGERAEFIIQVGLELMLFVDLIAVTASRL